MKYILCLLTMGLMTGCQAKPSTKPYAVMGTVIDDENQFVPNSRILLPGKKVATLRNETVQFELSGTEGETVRIHVECPDKWKAIPTDYQDVVLQRLNAVHNNEIHPIQVSFICVPLEKKHIVIVKTNSREQLPVEVMGEAVATTNDDGLAQFVIQGGANEEIELRIDTSGFPNYSPQMPSRLLQLPAKRRFFVFNQQFHMQTKPKKKRKTKRRRTTNRPKRI